MRLTLSEIARALGGRVVSGGVNFRAPGHSHVDDSGRVLVGPNYPNGFWVKSWSNDDELALKDYVAERLGLPRRGKLRVEIQSAQQFTSIEEIAKKKRIATLRWNEGRDPHGTIVEAYLASRALRMSDEVAGPVIRFHPECPWAHGEEIIRVPAMIAVMRDVRTNEITGLHRTRLTLDGRKIDRRMLGIAAGAAIKIDPDEAVTAGLIIGEGIETVLSACQLGFRPAWALGSVSAIAGFPVLGAIECLSILAESDATGANERAIADCACRWHDAGRTVLSIASRFGSDVNDAIREAV
jgi:putative DNA primase/helicase